MRTPVCTHVKAHAHACEHMPSRACKHSGQSSTHMVVHTHTQGPRYMPERQEVAPVLAPLDTRQLGSRRSLWAAGCRARHGLPSGQHLSCGVNRCPRPLAVVCAPCAGNLASKSYCSASAGTCSPSVPLAGLKQNELCT